MESESRGVGRPAHQFGCERVPVGVCVVAQHASADRHYQRGVLRQTVAVVHGLGRGVHQLHSQVDRHHGAVGQAVVGSIGEAVRSDIIWGGGVAETAVWIERESRGMGWSAHQHRRQRIPIRVAVIGQYSADGRHHQDRVLVNAVTVVPRQRRVVHLLHSQADRHHGAIGQTVVGPIGKAVRSEIVGRRCVAETAVCIQGERQRIRRPAHQHCRQRIPIRVAVVGQHSADGRHHQDRVFVNAVTVVPRHRGVVHLFHSQADRHRCAVGQAVVGPIGKAVRSDIVGRRCVAETAVWIQGERQRIRWPAHQHRR